jgi:hypothetical protein
MVVALLPADAAASESVNETGFSGAGSLCFCFSLFEVRNGFQKKWKKREKDPKNQKAPSTSHPPPPPNI